MPSNSTPHTASVIGISIDCARQHGLRAAHAFSHVAERAEDVVQRAAGRQLQADRAVARQVARGGEDQVAEAREAREGFRPAAERDTEARHFGEARNRAARAFRPRPSAMPVAIASTFFTARRPRRRPRRHLYRSASRRDGTRRACARGIRRTCSPPSAQRAATARPRERSSAPTARRCCTARQLGRDHLMRQQMRVGLEALADPDDMRGHAACVAHRVTQRAQPGHRRGDHAQCVVRGAMHERGAEIGVVAQRVRQRDAVQIAGIFVPGLQPGDERRRAPTKAYRAARPDGPRARCPRHRRRERLLSYPAPVRVKRQFSVVPFGAPAAAPACC